MRMYQVGGAVRDEILGVRSKDVDFSVVFEDGDLAYPQSDPFLAMVNRLKLMGFKIFLETPEHLTVRAQFPKTTLIDKVVATDLSFANGRDNLTADFVLARKEGEYSDGRRPDSVEPGTLMDDLARRDFTMNAIAKDADGSLIDPFNGVGDIEAGIIRAVGDPFERLTEDALRAVRAVRFAVTKGFKIDRDLEFAMRSAAVLHSIRTNISDERIQAELSKMFRFDTRASLFALADREALTDAMFAGRVSLDATMKTKGRGK